MKIRLADERRENIMKIRLADERREALKKIFDAQVIQFSQDDMSAQIATFFEDCLRALPPSALNSNVEAIIDDELSDWRGRG